MPTLETMRADALVEADLQSGQVDDGDVDRILNEELADLYELIVQSREDYFSSEADFTLVAGETAESLPVDFYQELDFEDLTDAANPISLPPFEFKDRNRTWVKGWCIHGDQILIRPVDSSPGSYRLTYVPQWVDLNFDDDFSPPNNWHKYAVLGAAIRLKEMQELSTSDLERRRDALEAKISNAARKRKGPRKVRDARAQRSELDRRLQDWRFQ